MGTYQHYSYGGYFGGDFDTNVGGDTGGYMGTGSQLTFSDILNDNDTLIPNLSFDTQVQQDFNNNNVSGAITLIDNTSSALTQAINDTHQSDGQGWSQLGTLGLDGIVAAAGASACAAAVADKSSSAWQVCASATSSLNALQQEWGQITGNPTPVLNALGDAAKSVEDNMQKYGFPPPVGSVMPGRAPTTEASQPVAVLRPQPGFSLGADSLALLNKHPQMLVHHS